MKYWIGVDLTGVLSLDEGWFGVTHIGPPIPAMVARIKKWRDRDIEVRIFTARAAPPFDGGYTLSQITETIQDWCEEHVGERLPVTCSKDRYMIKLFDDKVIQIEWNTGKPKYKGS